MKFDKDQLDKKWVAYSIATCSAVVLYLLLTRLSRIYGVFSDIMGYLSPVFIGGVIAVILNPIMNFFEYKVLGNMKKRGIAKTLAVFLTALAVMLFVLLFFVALIPQLVSSIATLMDNWNTYAGSIQDFLSQTTELAAKYNLEISRIMQIGDDMLAKITSKIPENVGNIVDASFSIGKGFFNGVISFILAIYFLLDKDRLKGSTKMFLKAVMPSKWNADFLTFSRKCYGILNGYVGGALLDALIVGIANFIFMSIVKMPFPLLVSVIVAVTNLAPTFGPVVGGALGALILVLIKPWNAVCFIIFTVVLQTLDGYVIKPKLFGGTFGVPAVWILVMIIVGGRMFGFWGIMLAIPVTAMLAYLYDTFVKKRIQKKSEKG